MKKIIFTYLLWLTSVAAHSQYTDPLIIANTDYLELSKKQKKAGWKCIGVSVVLITTGALLFKASPHEKDGGFLVLGLSGIPLGIALLEASSRSKRKGINLLLRKETVRQLQNNKYSYANIPALSLKISL